MAIIEVPEALLLSRSEVEYAYIQALRIMGSGSNDEFARFVNSMVKEDNPRLMWLCGYYTGCLRVTMGSLKQEDQRD